MLPHGPWYEPFCYASGISLQMPHMAARPRAVTKLSILQQRGCMPYWCCLSPHCFSRSAKRRKTSNKPMYSAVVCATLNLVRAGLCAQLASAVLVANN